MLHDDVVVAHHLVRVGRRDAPGIHDLAAGLLLALEDHRHDRLDARLQRRIGRRHQLLVVLHEIHAGVDDIPDQRRRLMRAQAQGGLDDGADDRPVVNPGQPARSGHAELRTGPGLSEGLGQLHVDDADAGETPDRIDAADGDGHQGREVGADGLEGKGDVGFRPMEGPRRVRRKGRNGNRRQGPQRHHPCGNPVLQLLGFAGNGHEGSGRLIAGDLRGQGFGIAGGLDQIGQGNEGLGCCHDRKLLRLIC